MSSEAQPGVGSLLLFLLPCAFTCPSGVLWSIGAVGAEPLDEAECARTAFLSIRYALMAVACVIRGRTIGRKWLVAFPIVASVFDLFLVFLSFMPSVMNIAVLTKGYSAH